MAKKKFKICKSCGGPVKEFDGMKVVNSDFCPYCVDEQGELKSYKDIVDLMIDYLKEDHKEIPARKRLDTAQKWLSENPAWEKKFINRNVVIENVREQNIKDIPAMNEKYDCQVCMYYMKNKKGKRTAKTKKEWFEKMQKKYGSCAKILYYKGVPVGYAQFALKKNFIKLEDLEPGSTRTDAWYISCIAIKQRYQGKGLGKLLLKSVLEDLKKRGVKKVHACGQIKGDVSAFSSGYWEMYEKLGFEEIASDKGFKVGEKIFNR